MAVRGPGLGRRAELSGPARRGGRKVRCGPRSGRARQRRAAGLGLLSGPEPPKSRTGRPQPGPAEIPAPWGAQRRKGKVQALLVGDARGRLTPPTFVQRPLCPRAGAGSKAGACPRVVGESHQQRLSTPGGERGRHPWRRAGSGARADPSSAVGTVWPGRMSRIFPGPRETRRRRASLPSVAGFRLPRLILNLMSLI